MPLGSLPVIRFLDGQFKKPATLYSYWRKITKEDAQRLIHDVLKTQPLSESEKSEACKRLHIFAAAGSDCTIVGPGPYDSHSRLEDLIAFCNSLPNIRLIGLDPAIALSKGRELDELDQRALANAVEKLVIQTGVSVVPVSHAAKSVQYQNEIGSHYSRGSGALTDALRPRNAVACHDDKGSQIIWNSRR